MSMINPVGSAMPQYSSRLYLHLSPGDISVLKFLLEAHDNLAYLSTVSPHTAVVKLVFAPRQAREVRDFLEEIESQVAVRVVWEAHDGESVHR